MLLEIEEKYRGQALILLKWLLYAKPPRSLSELVEATVIDLEDDNISMDNRGSLEDTLDILGGLITVI